jgi:hypothetical protein
MPREAIVRKRPVSFGSAADPLKLQDADDDDDAAVDVTGGIASDA